MASLRDWLFGLIGRGPRHEEGQGRHRGPATHVIVLDGTMSTLDDGDETNAGITFKLLREAGIRANLTVYYEAGIQWRDWSGTYGVMTGKGINRQIERAYGVLASRYRPGDKIILIGYSRGAYAVRSLAGVVGMVGLVRHDQATVRNIRQAYRHYRTGARSKYAAKFRELYCHPDTEIEAVACWDTVKALGMRLPIIWRWAEATHHFHDHGLSNHVRHGFHALALDETREAYAPVMWETPPDWPGVMEQVWFRGTHGDVGGQLGGDHAARPLANIPLVWLLGRLEDCGLDLPDGWRDRFPCDVAAPSIGTWRGWGKLFLSRRRRIVGRDPSERLHVTAQGHPKAETLDLTKTARLAGQAG
ncbi:DUF2235 domain-containing protein [Loktanella sp. IMCC34160]|uniref:DUF2235 domain-containing protein n=1 Tax=Loktanella sp. IMCC34160 TaxID=2510646 RepID=UPI00101E110E|nr:DUF2235 domain-containing protein [Loktanella sp. IMCC34160]RYG89700.1 DUF2235 domain-containing protein [Loktanella sp. IMCC34160]